MVSNIHCAVWVSAVPGSANVPVKVTAVPTAKIDPTAGPVMATAGGTLFTVTATSPVAIPPWPSSTCTRRVKEPLSVVAHDTAPVTGLIAAPGGEGATSEKVSVWAGRSGSVALAVKSTVAPSFTVRAPGRERTGGEFTPPPTAKSLNDVSPVACVLVGPATIPAGALHVVPSYRRTTKALTFAPLGTSDDT